ncbi:MAG: GMC family oxidoreductase [Formivibrio sp.]|nr:GMC family oxidoreductase [Formivibrio sp.]
MKPVDLGELEDPVSIQTDLCIVGSGPAGSSIAKEFAGSMIQVLVIEGGGTEESTADQALYTVENVGAIRAPQEGVRNRVVGGSSHGWSGRCTSFDEIDFESRAWVPNSGWPITFEEVRPFSDRSRAHLGLGPNVYDDHLWKKLGISPPYPQIDPACLKSQFWQYSTDQHNAFGPTRFSRTLAAIDASNVRLLIHANVTQINTSMDVTGIVSLDVRTLEGKRAEVKARVVVLACGGLENARLLLASNKIALNGIGNSHDLVGRFLMDHPGCKLGWFDPNRAFPIQDRFGSYYLDHESGRNAYEFGLAINDELQRKEQLLNCAAFLGILGSPDDPSGAAKRLISNVKLLSAETPRSWGAQAGKDISILTTNFPRLLRNAYRRFAKLRGAIVKAEELYLYCLVEQIPNPSSRVTLGERTDALGMPILRIDWRIGEIERRSVVRFNELIGSELRRVGLPKYTPNSHLSDDFDWRSNFVDRAHPSGTTRMADSPRLGVVDRNCKVHGVAGLYIAGSSVFPTIGHANPTLMIVAMAIRLADWLKRHEFANA